jgi:hypothetical protein
MHTRASVSLALLLLACPFYAAEDVDAARAVLGKWVARGDIPPLVFEKDGVCKYGWGKADGEWVMVAGTYKLVKDKGIDKVETDITHKGVRLQSWYRLLKDETGYYLERPVGMNPRVHWRKAEK